MTDNKETAPVNVTALIASLDVTSRGYVRARDFVIVRALDAGVKASVIVTEATKGGATSVTPSLVSRLNKARQALTKSQLRDLHSINLHSIEAGDPVAMQAAVKFADTRLVPSKVGGSKTPAVKETPDMRATIFDYIVNAEDPTAALAVVDAAVEQAKIALAEAQAAADAGETQAA